MMKHHIKKKFPEGHQKNKIAKAFINSQNSLPDDPQ